MNISLILVPSEGARIDDYWIIGDGCIKISWHPISEERSNGVIQGYNIYYELACHHYPEHDIFHTGSLNITLPDTLSATICDLYPGLQYRVRVAAFTSKGAGEYSDRDDIYAGKPFSCKSNARCNMTLLTKTDNKHTKAKSNKRAKNLSMSRYIQRLIDRSINQAVNRLIKRCVIELKSPMLNLRLLPENQRSIV